MTVDPFKPVLKVLLVDDDPETRQVVTMMVEKAGHVLLATGSGIAALSLLNREKVDVILLDIMMPELDGINLLETVRATSDVPILMVTAISNAAIMQQCYHLGADDYIVKPFTREKIIGRIERLAAKARASSTTTKKAPWTNRFWLDSANHLLVNQGSAIDLSDAETKLLARIMETPCQEVSDTDLYLAGWGAAEASAHTIRSMVEITIRGLQLKIEEDPEVPVILTTTRDGATFNPDCLDG